MRNATQLVKISRPAMAPALPRERLFHALEDVRDQPIVWVSGPAGSGKTTLAASYVEAARLPCLWYRIDEGDGDPAAFFYYLGLAAARAAPRIRRRLPLFTPEYHQGITTFAAHFFEDLFSRLKMPSVLVFDNYQEAPPDSLLHRLLAEGLQRVPRGIRVILTSRTAPLTEFSRFLASRSMALIGWNELRFTLDESGRVLSHWGRGALCSRSIERMHQLTQGWAAGLVLLSQQLDSGGEGPQFLADRPPEEVFGFFAGEIFQRIDVGTRDFLMKTALMPSFTGEMAERLTKEPNGGQLLAKLVRSNQFTEMRYESGVSYQYHPLFRSFLQNRVVERFDSHEILDLRRRAAALLEESGQMEDALNLYREAGEWSALVRIILGNAQELIVQGRNRTLHQWLNGLPIDMLEASPWLLYWKGIALLSIDPMQARKCCERAYTRFRAQSDATGLFLCWATIMDSIFWLERDRAGPLDHWMAELEELLSHFPGMPSPEVDARVSMSMFAAIAWYRPSHPNVAHWEEKNLALLQRCTDPDQKVMIGNWLTLFYLYRGEMAKVEMILDVLRPIPGHAPVAPTTRIVLSLLESYLQQVRGNREGCEKAIDHGIETAVTSGVHILDFFLFASRVIISVAYGDPKSARTNMASMAALLSGKSRNDVAHYHYLAGFEAFSRRDNGLALQHLEISLQQVTESGTEHQLALCRIALAEVLFEMGDSEAAEVQLTQALDFNQAMRSHLLDYMISLVQARSHMKRGLVATGREYLASAFALGREKGVISIQWHVPFVQAELCGHALEAGIEVEYVQELIRKFKLLPPDPPVACEKWPWPVRILCLGEFSVFRNGEKIDFPVKAQKKPLEMLKFLVASGERGTTEEQVSDALWPDADGARAHQAFATTLHRLRKLLGHEEAIRLREGRLTLEPLYFWVDSWAFEKLAREADHALRAGQNEDGLKASEKAIHHYNGRFLGTASGEYWAESYGNRLQSRYLRCVESVGKHLEEACKWDAAAAHYSRGLEMDELAERFYQRLMHCLGAMGRKAEMQAVYRRCQKALQEHLGMDPSPETEALRNTFLSGKPDLKRAHLKLV